MVFDHGAPYPPHKDSPYRKHITDRDYLLFSRLDINGDIEVFAVFHATSGWASLIGPKMMALPDLEADY